MSYADFLEDKCPKCGANHFQYHCTGSTCMGTQTVIENGQRVIHDGNWYFDYCTCLECGEEFTVIKKQGQPNKVKSGRRNYCSLEQD